MNHFLVGLAALAIFGCGSTVDTASGATSSGGGKSSTGTQTGSGGAGTGSVGGGSSTSSSGLADASSSAVGGTTGTSAGGAGGAGGVGTGGGTGGSAGGACQGIVQMTVDNGAQETLPTSCKGTWGANQSNQADAYAFAGGPVGAPHGVEIDGCKTVTQGAEGIELSVLNANGVGTYTMGTPVYIDPNGVKWGMDGDAFSVKITKLQGVGGVVEGTFSVNVSHGGNAAHAIDGSFHVCHVHDELAP